MNSFNHYAYGAIGDWMYRVVAGIDTDESGPGYRRIKIQPHIGGGLTNASASLQTYYGTVSSGWKKEGNQLIWEVEIPANTTAVLYIPAKGPGSVIEGTVALDKANGIKVQGAESDYVMVEAGSGKYRFVIE
jgi:alpha-L-rhamnosidase